MTVTSRLEQEHRHVLRLLEAVERLARRVRDGERPLDAVSEALDLLRTFADEAHHAKEELHLFPALNAAGLPRRGGPVAVLLLEHDAGRGELDAMTAALGELRRGAPTGASRFVRAASGYVALLRDHIAKENDLLFPIARELLPASAAAALEIGYAAVDAETFGPGGYERVLTRIEALVASTVDDGGSS